MLVLNGRFRCIVPDLQAYCIEYLLNIKNNNTDSAHIFLNKSLLGRLKRDRGFKAAVIEMFGNAEHQYMWDSLSLIQELKNTGFKDIRICEFNDSHDFNIVEDKHRFVEAVAVEATK